MRNILKTTAKNSLAVMTSLLYFSCTVNTQEEASLSSMYEKIPVSISSEILQVYAHARMAENKFENKDAIGLYILEESEKLNSTRHIDNMRFTCTPEGFSPDEEVFYPSGNGKCNFISYYPYQSEGFTAGTSDIQVTTNANQTTAEEYSISDFMLSYVAGITPSKNAVELKFDHKLCQLNLILQLTENNDIEELQQKTIVSINNVYTQAIYNFENDQITSHSNKAEIIPNGEWKIDETHLRLIGKRAIIIPQQTDNSQITLRIGNRLFTSPFPKNMVLTSNTSYELTLKFDSRNGISGITPIINDWNNKEEHEGTFEEEDNLNTVYLSDLNFEKTNVYNVVNQSNTVVGELCKEYLLNDDIDTQAIVFYPSNSKEQGTVLQILDKEQNIHSGTVIWNVENNSFIYTNIDRLPIENIYINKEGNVTFEAPDEPQNISVQENMLTDIRGAETILYPIVKIGIQYWMRDNLNTTQYNTGTGIVNNSSNLTKTSAGYYIQGKQHFYNQAAVITGKIAPKGWKIPESKDWTLLQNYIRNKTEKLKTGSDWEVMTDILVANNQSGFSSIPTGFYTKGLSNSQDCSKYNKDFTNQYTGYWCAGNSQNALSEYAISLQYNSNEINTSLKYNEYSAYSIRCIKE